MSLRSDQMIGETLHEVINLVKNRDFQLRIGHSNTFLIQYLNLLAGQVT